MKILIFSLFTLLSAQSFAADLAEKHAAFCESTAVREVRGEKDTCRIVLNLSPAEKAQGSCTGMFRGVLPCVTAFVTYDEGSAMQLICGTDPQKPAIDQILRATATNYTVSAVVTKEDESELIVTDPATYSLYESSMVGLTLSKSEEKLEGTVTLQLRTGPVELTDVKCQ